MIDWQPRGDGDGLTEFECAELDDLLRLVWSTGAGAITAQVVDGERRLVGSQSVWSTADGRAFAIVVRAESGQVVVADRVAALAWVPMQRTDTLEEDADPDPGHTTTE